MSGFSAQWLTMRESADHQSRNTQTVRATNAYLGKLALPDKVLRIVDLGCGTGSNLRWLAPRLNANQQWLMFDNDSALLRQAWCQLSTWAGAAPVDGSSLEFEAPQRLQLKRRLAAQLQAHDLNQGLPCFEGAHLVSAAALIDLVSTQWLLTVARTCAATPCAIIFALNFDGRVQFTPHHHDDAMMRDALNTDQLSDKGFGPALGPNAIATLQAQCQQLGYQVQQWRSDWLLRADQRALHGQLIDDLANIAHRVLPDKHRLRIEAWQQWRQQNIDTSVLRVGHCDVLATPRR